MRGPTRPNVLSTHSATSSNVRGIRSGLGLKHQREGYFHGVGHLVRALPVALSGPEIQAFELGTPLELCARGTWSELKVDRHVLGHAPQCQCTDGRITRGGFGEAAGDVVSCRPVRHV